MVDVILIGRKLDELDTYLEQLKEFADISLSKYRKDWKTQRIVERTLQILIELCIDIANHIISDSKMRIPTSYADTFKILTENKIVSKTQYRNLEKMAKFRNVIVHHYEDIDPAIVVSILRKNIKDFEAFKNSIIKYLNRNQT